MDGQTDGRMDGQTELLMDGRTGGLMDGPTSGLDLPVLKELIVRKRYRFSLYDFKSLARDYTPLCLSVPLSLSVIPSHILPFFNQFYFIKSFEVI